MSQKRLAIVGFAFRFPGPQGDGFWTALTEGRNLITTVDPSRWSQDQYLHPRESEPGTSYTFAGGSLGDVSGFDAAFFGISPREAAQMDPQQRLLLELTWEALESGGIPPSSIRGSRCGAFIGFSGSDYSYRRADDMASIDAFLMTGNTASIAANRISYCFDLRGPSMAVDTACSSSLVALHQACQSLRAGESDLAIAGAVSLHLHPLAYIGFSKASMLSKSGSSRAFDAAGDGYVRSEGGGIVVLKPLERALAEGNRIFAVVAGTGVNSDGKTSSLMVPSCEAQAALLREVYARAGIEPAEIDYLEAHGTGTAVGDPIEARALGEALGKRRHAGSPLRIGSVKSNLGHLETAAGMAGLIKSIYCLRRRMLPPSINFETPNPHIAFEESNLEVVTGNTPLEPGKRLVVGINSFGFGGANAHVILESFPEPQPVAAGGGEAAVPLFISGRSESALRDAALRMAAWLRDRKDLPFYDIACSAAFHRDWHEYRGIAFGPDRDAVAASLAAFAKGREARGLAAGRALQHPAGPVFVYSGNGAQWAGMGKTLLAEETVFRQSVAAVSDLFLRHSRFSILQALESEDLGRLLEATEVAQPLLFAVQVGITELLHSWDIHPAAVVGHSVGEIAAAWASGALQLEQAVRVVYERSAWQGTTRGTGSMTAVAMGADDAAALLASMAPSVRLTLAAINSPASVTVAGAGADLTTLEAALAARGTSYRRLQLNYAFHSPAMDPIRSGVEAALRNLTPAAGTVPFYSAVDGDRLAGDCLDTGYWWRNIREPVKFEQAAHRLIADGQSIFLEIGPQPILRNYLNECLAHTTTEGRVIPTMMRSGDGSVHLRTRAFETLLAGRPSGLERLFPVRGRCVDLPGYPWQRERHWYSVSAEGLDLINRRAVHPLLGYRVSPDENLWESQLDLYRARAFGDHRLGKDAVFPAAGFAEMALAASAELHPEAHVREVEDLEIRAPLLLDDRHSRSLRLAVDPAGGLAITSRERLSGEAWRTHAVARLPAGSPPSAAVERFDLPEQRNGIPASEHYRLTSSVGLEYGPAYQAVEEAWVARDSVSAILATPAALRGEIARSWLHPVFLDAGFQLLVHLLRDEAARHEGVAFVPIRIGRLSLLRPHAEIRFARIELLRRGPRSLLVHCTLYAEDREAVAVLRDVRFRAVTLREPALGGLTFLDSCTIPMPLATPRGAASLPPAGQLNAACAARLHAPARQRDRQHYASTVEPLLEAVFCAFAAQAVREVADEDVAAVMKPLLARFRQIAGEDDLPPADELWQQLLGDYPDHAPEILWLGRIGASLGRVLRGAVRPEIVLRPYADDRASDDWAAATLPCANDFAQAISNLVGACVRELPSGRRLRVLALDAGHAASHGRVSEVLDPACCDLVVRAALDPAPGTAGVFDLVLVEDGLLWSKDRDRALHDLRAGMADDGLLVLLERRPSRAVALAIEALSDSADPLPGARPMAPEAWRAALTRRGFVVESIAGDAPDAASGAYLVLARAEASEAVVAAPAQGATPATQRCWIVLSDRRGYSSDIATRVATQLELLGCVVHRIHQPEAGVGITWEDVLKSVRGECGEVEGVVHLAGLRSRLEQQAAHCESLAGLLEACTALGMRPACWLVTARSHERPEEAPLWGFARTAINEYPNLALRLVDLAEPEARHAMALALAESLLHPDAENELILTSNGRRVVRLGAAPAVRILESRVHDAPARSTVRLELQHPGQLKNLAWTRRPLRELSGDEVEIEVRAAGLNFRDVMFAIGQLPDEALEGGYAGATLGMELSGVVSAVGPGADGVAVGDEVMAFAPASFSTRAITRAGAVLAKPPAWSFEAAAAVPTAFFTAYYALHHLARLVEGERVLIHGAAGGVGLAAVQLARLAGAEVFATAGSETKRDVLRLLGVEHVLDSRSLGFDAEILARTDGRGVDVVLNSLAGEAMLRSLGTLGPLGRFLELGKRDFYENTRIGLRPMRNNITYFGIDVDQLMLERPDFTRRLMQALMSRFEQGDLRPLPYRAFAAADAVSAFRHMQQSRHIGKVVLSLDPAPLAQRIAAGPARRLALQHDATYLVTGGLRGFGLKTAHWLADRGARHLVLAGRSGASTPEAQAALAELTARGVQVKVAACDVASRASLKSLLAEIRESMPALRGVVHAAAVIDDGLIRTLTRERLQATLAPKARGAANLHALTRDAALDFFVLFSSAATCFGNPGQAGYVAANRYLEVLAHARRAAGLPALCVSWGPIGDVGYLARHPEIRERLESRFGGSALASDQALRVLEQMLLNSHPDGAVVRFDRGLPRLLASARTPKYERLLAQVGEAADAASDQENLQRWLQELDDVELARVLGEVVTKEIGSILRMPPDKLELHTPLQDLGLDSLMGVELMTAVEARFGVEIPAMAVSELGTIERLVALIIRELRRGQDGAADTPETAFDDHARQVAGQYAPEIDRGQVDAFLDELKASGK